MTRTFPTRAFRICAITALCSAGALPSVSAEPVTVTSGAFVVAWDDPAYFVFFGPEGFFLGGLFVQTPSSPQRMCFSGCLPGASVDMSADVGGESAFTPFTLGLSTGAVINGTEFFRPFGLQAGSPWLAGRLRFDAPTIVLPPLGSGLVTFTGPFVFSGEVTGFARDDLDARVPLFEVALLGRGTVTAMFDAFDGAYREPEVIYTFAPVPEPTTLALFGSGLAGLAVRRWWPKRPRRAMMQQGLH